MNKLVSKNPVQRFKQGKKIEKMQFGKNFKRVGTASNGLSGIYFNPDDNKLYKGGLTGYTFIGDRYSYYNGLGGGVINASDYIPKEKNSSLQTIKEEELPETLIVSQRSKKDRKPSQTGKTTTKKASIPITVFAGHKIGKTGGLNYNIDDADRQQLIKTGQFKDSDFINAMSAQQALNRYFANSGLGSVTEDGAWGDQSRAALALALSKSRSLTPSNNETTVVKTPIIPTYTPPTTPINQEVANLNLNVPTYVTADRSQTRDWMRTNGINPYSVSGAMRAAARRLRAGQADDNDKLLVKGNEQLYNLLKGYYKQGGQLPSRNPVKRFKQRNFR